MEREAATNLIVRPTRIAWIVLLVVGLGLAALLLLTPKPVHAATVAPGSTGFVPLDDEAEEEFEGEADAAEECFEAEEEFEEGEISSEELEEFCEDTGGAGGILPDECLLRTFRPQLVATGDKAQLTIRYTTYEPTKATVDYGLKGLHLGTAKLHLGQKGVLHLTEHLNDSQAAKVRESHKAKVQIRIPSAPSSCGRYFSAQLTAQHGSPDRVTFAPKQKG
jgi:hypothetical protein